LGPLSILPSSKARGIRLQFLAGLQHICVYPEARVRPWLNRLEPGLGPSVKQRRLIRLSACPGSPVNYKLAVYFPASSDCLGLSGLPIAATAAVPLRYEKLSGLLP